MSGAFVPLQLLFSPKRSEPLLFNLFQLDTIDALIGLSADEAVQSDDKIEHAAGWVVRQSYPPMAIAIQTIIPHPDDDGEVIHTEVETALVPAIGARAIKLVLDRFSSRIMFKEDAHAETIQGKGDAGANRSDFLTTEPGAGVPIIEHKRLSEVLTQLAEFLATVENSGFVVEL